MIERQLFVTGLGVGESPRWHEGRLWFCNWAAREIIAVDVEGNREVIAPGPKIGGYCIDWLPDGRLLVTDEWELLGQEHDGSLVTHHRLVGAAAIRGRHRGRRPREHLRQRPWIRLRSRGLPADRDQAEQHGRSRYEGMDDDWAAAARALAGEFNEKETHE